MKFFSKEKDGDNRIIHIGLNFCYKKKKNLKPNPITIKNQELKDSAASKRCFVIATGPSMSNQELAQLKGHDCYTLSNAFLHKDINTIKPKFHFFAPYHEPLILENFIDWFKLADQKLPPETDMILGYTDYEMVQKHNLFPNRKKYYLALTYLNELHSDITLPILAPQTGPIMMLPVMDYMGYEEICLIGIDMNRLKDFQGTTSNFYTNDPRKNATNDKGWIDIMSELKRTHSMFNQFKIYNDYFSSKGKKLINLSPISWIDFIEKKDFNQMTK